MPSSVAQQLTWAREVDIAQGPYKEAMYLEELGYILDEEVAVQAEEVAVLVVITYLNINIIRLLNLQLML